MFRKDWTERNATKLQSGRGLALLLSIAFASTSSPIFAENDSESNEKNTFQSQQSSKRNSPSAETNNMESRDEQEADKQEADKQEADKQKPDKQKPDKQKPDKQKPDEQEPDEKTRKTSKKKREFADVLPCITWQPETEPRAVILCVHGLGLHNDSYEEFGKRMSARGYTVFAVDMPGFGSFKEAGEGRNRVDFDKCLTGLRDTLRFIHKVNPKIPVFVLGESMGGAIALRITSEYPELIDGLISSVPSGDRFNQGKETLKVGIKLLTAPNKPFDIGSSVIDRATNVDEMKKHWADDPLNRMNLTPKELVRFQGFMNDNHESAKKIDKTPVLVVQGCKDELVRPEGTIELFNALSTEDRKLELIHDGEHLIFEEGQFHIQILDEVIVVLDKWLKDKIDNKQKLSSSQKDAESNGDKKPVGEVH